MIDVIPIVAIIATFGSLTLILFWLFKTRNSERIALLEHGKDASVFKTHKTGSYPALKWGLLLAGVGFGLFLGILLAELSGLPEQICVPSMALFCGGAGLVVFYLIPKKREAAEKIEN